MADTKTVELTADEVKMINDHMIMGEVTLEQMGKSNKLNEEGKAAVEKEKVIIFNIKKKLAA